MLSKKNIFFPALFVFGSSLFSLMGATNLDQAMTDQEKQQTGVFNLTPEQKQALGIWIDNNYSLINPKTPKDQDDLHLSINIKNGQQLILSDGSLWQIAPSDLATSALWITPFPIQISPSDDPQYPWTLTNLVSKQKVKAQKLKSGTSP